MDETKMDMFDIERQGKQALRACVWPALVFIHSSADGENHLGVCFVILMIPSLFTTWLVYGLPVTNV